LGSTGGRSHIYPQDKTTPLFIAASGGHADAARALIEAGAEVDVACGDSAVTEVRLAESGHVRVPGRFIEICLY
jgi:hypothetical protein